MKQMDWTAGPHLSYVRSDQKLDFLGNMCLDPFTSSTSLKFYGPIHNLYSMHPLFSQSQRRAQCYELHLKDQSTICSSSSIRSVKLESPMHAWLLDWTSAAAHIFNPQKSCSVSWFWSPNQPANTLFFLLLNADPPNPKIACYLPEATGQKANLDPSSLS